MISPSILPTLKSLFEKSFWVKLFALKPSFFFKTRFLPQSRRAFTTQRITIFSKPCQVNRRGLVSKPDGLGDPTPTLRCSSLWIDKSTAPWDHPLLFKTGSKINARFEIINQMEKKWEVEGHKDIPEKRDTRYGSPRLFPLKTHFLESSIFYVYWSMALLLTVCRLYAKCAISSKSLLITSLIPFVVICICFVIAVLYHSRTWRGDKQRNS